MALIVKIEKVMPFFGSTADSSSKAVHVIENVGIIDAQVAADRAAVTVMRNEVSEAHAHIHRDKDQVTADKNTVAADRAQVGRDKDAVSSDRRVVAQDKADSQSLRAQTQEIRNQTESLKNDALSYRNTANQHATTATAQASTATSKATEATNQANRAKSEADRAQRLADGININGGQVTGNLTVTGSITEGGTPLSSKYATPAQLTALEQKIVGGASGAYDTLKEIEAHLNANAGQVGNIINTMATKADKENPRFHKILELINGDYGARLLPHTDGHVYFQGGKTDGNVDDQKVVMGGWYGKNLTSFTIAMADRVNPTVQWSGHKHAIYHAGNKPSWNDIGGDNMFSLSGDHIIPKQNWLRTSTRGLVPAMESASGHGSIGTPEWQFSAGYISTVYSRQLKVGERSNNVMISKVGNRMVFSV